MEIGLIVGLPAGALAGYLAGAGLRFARFGKFAALTAGALGGGVGIAVAARIAANSHHAGLMVPGGGETVISALVTGSIGGAAMVAALGAVKTLLAES